MKRLLLFPITKRYLIPKPKQNNEIMKNRKADLQMSSQEEIVIDELLSVLEGLVSAYQDLNILGNDKKKVLASDNLKSLQDIIHKEEGIATSIQMLEERRILLQKSIQGCPVSQSQLIALLDEPRKGRAISLSQELKKLVHSVGLINEANASIIRHLKNFLNHNRNILLGVSTVPDYGNDGSTSNYMNKKSYINRTI